MVVLESLSLRELLALRERMWTDPQVARLVGSDLGAKFWAGERWLADAAVRGRRQRLDAIERRLVALEVTN